MFGTWQPMPADIWCHSLQWTPATSYHPVNAPLPASDSRRRRRAAAASAAVRAAAARAKVAAGLQ